LEPPVGYITIAGMKALRFDSTGLHLAEIPIPSVNDEVLIKVSLSGICNTDLEIEKGYAGFQGTLGHEFVGVATAGELARRRVVGEINVGCGSCEKCRAGDSRHCAGRSVLGIVDRDGAHAEYVSLPERNLIAVPDNVSDEMAVFVEPLAAAYGILELVNISRDARIAVVGDGKLGLLCAMTLRLHADDVTLIGKHPAKISIAERAGANGVLLENADSSGPFDLVVEASGSEAGFMTAIDRVRPRGTVVLKSTFKGPPSWDASKIVVNEVKVVGSRCGRFEPALELLASGRIDPTPLISAAFKLSAGVEAMRHAAEKDILKVLLHP
jgi:threonine dehydrogenase-like Zn-dependent dehydrogenase